MTALRTLIEAVELSDYRQTLFGPCQCCGVPGMLYRQNSQYANEASNWVVLCADHMEENDEYWAERWAEYWAGVM